MLSLLQEQEQENDENKITFEIEETTEPKPTTEERILASLRRLKASLADLFVNFVIMPNSKLMLIKYINCLFVFATTLTITYMVSQRTCNSVRLPTADGQKKPGLLPRTLSRVGKSLTCRHKTVLAINLVFEV